MKTETYYIAIHTPTISTAQVPSMEFKAVGYLTDKEVNELESRLHGYLSNVVMFKSKKDFEQSMQDMDKAFWQ